MTTGTISRLTEAGELSPPAEALESIQYEVVTGSTAYGVSRDASDLDIVAFCIPPKTTVFPHLTGHIEGFGRRPQGFNSWQCHRVKSALTPETTYDLTIYSIVKFFQLCTENNPNMIDLLFVPQERVLYTTKVGDLVRANRDMFVHKGAYHKFRGYAFSQLQKLQKGVNKNNPARAELIAKYGYDTKFAYHIFRLALEAEQLLLTGRMDLRKDAHFLISIREGLFPSVTDIVKWFDNKEKELGELYQSSTVQHSPDFEAIQSLLEQCLGSYYGEVLNFNPEKTALSMIKQIQRIVAQPLD